jgi:hypothetical protein
MAPAAAVQSLEESAASDFLPMNELNDNPRIDWTGATD